MTAGAGAAWDEFRSIRAFRVDRVAVGLRLRAAQAATSIRSPQRT